MVIYMKKIDIGKLIFYIASTFIIGCLFISKVNNNFYAELDKPFNLPSVIFPIVWTILYILISISIYRARNSRENNIIYYINMFLNSIWTLIFFGFKNFLLSFIILVLLLLDVIIMFFKFKKSDKVSAYLLIPYILWLFIAGYLNLSIYLLNK